MIIDNQLLEGFEKQATRYAVFKTEKINEGVKGKFIELTQRLGDNGEIYDVACLDSEEEGYVSVYPGKAVTDHIRQTVKPGDEIIIVYRGEETTRKGRKVKIWDLYTK